MYQDDIYYISISRSSFSSNGSQRVRIKAKYLKEIKSPFDDDLQNAAKERPPSNTGYIPPALPGNRPKEYAGEADDLSRHRLSKGAGEEKRERKKREQSKEELKNASGSPRSDSGKS